MALPSGFPKNIIWKNIDRKNEIGNGWGDPLAAASDPFLFFHLA